MHKISSRQENRNESKKEAEDETERVENTIQYRNIESEIKFMLEERGNEK